MTKANVLKYLLANQRHANETRQQYLMRRIEAKAYLKRK